MKKKVIVLVVAIIFFNCFMLVSSCETISKYNTVDRIKCIKESYYDTLLNSSIEYFIDSSNWYPYYDMKEFPRLHCVDTILFNQDSTKLFALVQSQLNKQNFANPEVDFSISENALFGEKEKNIWKIYPYKNMMLQGYYSATKASNYMRRHFITQFKEYKIKTGDEHNSLKKVTYNPTEKEFWTLSPFYKKIRGRYRMTYYVNGRGVVSDLPYFQEKSRNNLPSNTSHSFRNKRIPELEH